MDNSTANFIRSFLAHMTPPRKQGVKRPTITLALHPSKYEEVKALDFGEKVTLVSDKTVGLDEVRATKVV